MSANDIWDAYSLLHHYTSQDGLEGILQSQTLHATHFKYLNDFTEMQQMEPKLVAEILPEVNDILAAKARSDQAFQAHLSALGGIDLQAQSLAHTIVSGLFNATFGRNGAPKFLTLS
ncbi:hypothetical protein [Hyphomicrobium sp.]|uniref:hypothetical protein n=1 Tax=Hyphomicrobium sp. TaxID=82 RepID=UPI003F713EF1